MSKRKETDPLVVRLDALLRLELEQMRQADETLTVGDQILVLQDTGLTQAEAARILGVPHNQIPSYMRNVNNKRLLAKLVKKRNE